MKCLPHWHFRSSSGLTLPELLFASALLGVVGYFVFHVGLTNCTIPAGRAKASSILRSIVNATKAYESDYYHLPLVETQAPRTSTERFILVGDPRSGAPQSNAELFNILRSIGHGKNANHTLNPRKVVYFESNKASTQHRRDGFADGVDFPPEIQGQLLDPWGNQYCVVMATNGESALNLRSIYSDLVDEIKLECVAVSLGKDGTLGSPKAPGRLRPPKENSPSDVVSWE